ncbi:MAG: ROK family protein [Bacteroidales bacterium]|nr:ROK family protein [Bacteroidales bacterium]
MEDRMLVGVDIGGTKCAITLGEMSRGTREGDIRIKDKASFLTTDVSGTIRDIKGAIKGVLERNQLTDKDIQAIGISCGGPLDSKRGVVMSPPNLPGWDNIPIVDILREEFGVKAAIHNDANACALAEWKFGAGKGTRNMVFMTFGTGLGAGLIIDGKLYTGTNDNAGELGHLRLESFGPVGYGKAGSFEGFCSGSGIGQLARDMAMEAMQMGLRVPWCPDGDLSGISAKKVAEALREGDPLAKRVYEISARHLGYGLSMVIDILNPEMIVIGSIFARNEDVFRPLMEEVIGMEALPLASKVCKIVPAALGEAVGDYAALSIAADIQ